MAVTDYAQPLELLELPEPVLGAGQALLQVVACGVCYSDVKTVDGRMPFSDRLALPHVAGHEICARVIETDPPGVFEPGALVTTHHYVGCGRCGACRAGEENLCVSLQAWIGFTHPGGFQERLVVPIDRLFAVPDGIDPVHASPLTCAIGTAYRSVVTRGAVRAGTRVAVLGLGGVGIHTVQIARATGAHVAGIDASEAAIVTARSLGVEALLAPAAEVSDVHDLLGGPADVVIDNVGADTTLAFGTSLLRAGGTLVGVGYSPGTRLAVDTTRFVLDELTLVGSRYVARDELARAIDLVARGAVEPVVGAVRDLEDVNDVLDQLRAGTGLGRTVLRVCPET